MATQQRILVDDITADPKLWPRKALGKERVDEFTGLYAEGSALPALEVRREDTPDAYTLIDGWHRLEALKAAGRTDADAVVYTREEVPDVYFMALKRSAINALPMTSAEKRAAVARLLAEHPNWSDRQIAELVGLSHTTVGTVRAGGQIGQRTDSAGRQAAPKDPVETLLKPLVAATVAGDIPERKAIAAYVRSDIAIWPDEDSRAAAAEDYATIAEGILEGAKKYR